MCAHGKTRWCLVFHAEFILFKAAWEKANLHLSNQSLTNGPICLVVSIVSSHLKNMVPGKQPLLLISIIFTPKTSRSCI